MQKHILCHSILVFRVDKGLFRWILKETVTTGAKGLTTRRRSKKESSNVDSIVLLAIGIRIGWVIGSEVLLKDRIQQMKKSPLFYVCI